MAESMEIPLDHLTGNCFFVLAKATTAVGKNTIIRNVIKQVDLCGEVRLIAKQELLLPREKAFIGYLGYNFFLLIPNPTFNHLPR